MTDHTPAADSVFDQVRDCYAAAALSVTNKTAGTCCVVNLSPDKPTVFGEIYRVLRPGGRIGISDLVADDHLTTEDRAPMGTHADCIAGALTSAEYAAQLADAGFTEITLTRSHTVTEGLHSTIIRATKSQLTKSPLVP